MEGEGEDLAVLLARLRGEAVAGAVEKGYPDADEGSVAGKIFLSSLSASPVSGSSRVWAHAVYSIIFD